MTRYFTLAEANAMLTLIRPWIEEAIRIRDEVMARQPEIWPVIERAVGNGGNAAISKVFFDFNRLDDLVHRIQETGAIVKDISIGLVDFPARREGREVYLCWKYGEERIQFWHEPEAGFAGRQPIEQF
ncbi:MAG: DUF2203 domain-containing protein [Anaerolineae bacterium]